jgi:Ion channel
VTVLATIAGVALIALAVRDVFDTLFHPHGRGVVSEALVRAVWRALHRPARTRSGVLSYAGPAAFVLVVLTWVALVVVGFALITLPHMPDEYVYDVGLRPEDSSGFFDAVYLSLVNLTSLGYGDIAPESDALRLLGPLETMIGLGILTASISWILSIYAVLADYRSVSHEIELLCDAEERTGVALAETEPAEAAHMLGTLSSKLVAARRDILHFPIAYYFHTRDRRYALSMLLPRLLSSVERCDAAGSAASVRLEAARLTAAIDDFMGAIDDEFLGGTASSTADAIAPYQDDQLRTRAESR